MTLSNRPGRSGAPRRAAPAWLAACTALAGCAQPMTNEARLLPPLPPLTQDAGRATPRVNGAIAGSLPLPQIAVSNGPGVMVSSSNGAGSSGGGNVTLDFADTDIREVVAQILGNTLHVNYAIDPSVHGTATLRTVTPLSDKQLIPVLQSLLAQNGATLVNNGGVYRVLPTAAAAGMAGGPGTAGGTMVPLRYAAAEDLAKVLQPYVQGGARLVAVPSSNALVIGGEPAQRDALVELVRAFDIDVLAGQSYALFPVPNGAAEDFATALAQAFRSQQGGTLASQVKVVPLARVDAVLVVTSSPRYLNDARRVYAVVERGMRQTMRTWHVYYVQNSTANDTAYILQQAFTPDNVTAQPTARGQGQPSQQPGGISAGSSLSGGAGSSSAGGIGSSSGGIGGSTGGLGGGLSGGSSTGGLGSGLGSSTTGSGGQGAPTHTSGSTGANPLLGGLSSSGGGGQANANEMRIIPNPENNAILVYATGEEELTVEAMLHKVDILPLQVRIDVIIAEVDLNDNLQYGTEYYFRHHGFAGAFGQAASILAGGSAAGPAGPFSIGVSGGGGDFILQALQGIATVKVLSSPELLVLDNETASLSVGNLVPYLTGQATPLNQIGTSLTTVNSISYQKTGVITTVTPRVNSGGLVTLDIAQEVSGIAQNSGTLSSTTGSGIQSPTFTDRAVQSRIVAQDGETVGLAGLITDNVARQNSGIPILKNIPILSFLTSTQTNTRARTELLVLLTPHVLHDQRDARSLTEDLRQQLPRAAFVPYELQTLPRGGSDYPHSRINQRLGTGP